MANTCCNTIKITGPKNKLTLLQKAITGIMRNRPEGPLKYADTYNLLLFLGYTPEQLAAVSCREDFPCGEPTLKDGVLTLDTESSWRFQGEAWELVKKKYPSVDIWFRAKEFGCDIFCTNDTSGIHFSDKYCLDWQDESGAGEIEYFKDDCALIEYVHENIDASVGDWASAMKAIEELNAGGGDSFGCLHEIEYENSWDLN